MARPRIRTRRRGHGRPQATRSGLVPVIGAMSVGAMAMAVVALVLDNAGSRGAAWYPSWIEFGDATEIRNVVAIVAGAAITVVTLLASMTLVALTLATSSLGARQIRSFLRDPVTRVTFGAFFATFAAAMVVLAGDRAGETPVEGDIGTLVVFLWLTFATVMLIVFLGNLTTAIQPNRVLARVADELAEAIVEHGRDREPAAAGAGDGPAPPWLPARAPDLAARAPVSGYVQAIDLGALVDRAQRHDGFVVMRVHAGHFVLEGEAVADVWGPAGLGDAVAGALVIGSARSLAQDLEFAIDQLVETGIRALSPGINDTFTGLMCVDWLGDAIRQLAAAPPGVPLHRDAAGTVRVVERRVTFESACRAAFEKMRHAAATSPPVLRRLFWTLGRLGPLLADDEQRRVVAAHVEAVWVTASAVPAPDDAELRRSYRGARAALGLADDAG